MNVGGYLSVKKASNCTSNVPLPVNQCTTPLSTYMSAPDHIRGFCASELSSGDKYRGAWCQQMGAPSEWGISKIINPGNCNFPTCKPYVEDSGIIGAQVACRRIGYTGDPLTCCMNNYAAVEAPVNNDRSCFSDAGAQSLPCCQQDPNAPGWVGPPNCYLCQNTCDPQYQDITSTGCQDNLLQYCSGTLPTDDYTSDAWLDRWTTPLAGSTSQNTCLTALQDNLFAGSIMDPPIPPVDIGVCDQDLPAGYDFNPGGYFWGQQLLGLVMQHYADNGYVLGSLPGDFGFNPFQDIILYQQICCPYPGLCQVGLNTACAGYTAERISYDPGISNWCGCHLPAEVYAKYANEFDIPVQCTPSCNRANVIPLVGINANPITCTQNVCLIDNTTVNLLNAQVGGGIDVTQICGNCGPQNPQGASTCSCIVNGTTIDAINTSIGGNLLPVSQACGSYTCSQPNTSGVGPANLNVPCSSIGSNPFQNFEDALTDQTIVQQRSSLALTVVIILIILVVIFLLIFFLLPR